MSTHTWVVRTLLALNLAFIGACGGPDFDAVRAYKSFLEEAKPSLTKMNGVRMELFNVGEPQEIFTKFRDGLLPEVKRLAKLAAEQPTPETTRLAEIHTTLKKVLADYAEATTKLVERLQSARDDRDREAALVAWGELDQKFGADMSKLVEELTAYLDAQMKK